MYVRSEAHETGMKQEWKMKSKMEMKKVKRQVKQWMKQMLLNCNTLGIEEGEYYVQQDNSSKHTSKKVKKWSENNGIQVIF